MTTQRKRPDKGKETEQTPTELRLEELLTKENDLKRRSLKVADLYEATSGKDLLKVAKTPKQLDKIRNCGEVKIFAVNGDMSARRLLFSVTCGNRTCPNCAKAQSVTDMKEALAVTRALTGPYKEKVAVFATFTIVNTERLEDGMNQLAHAFDKLMRRKEVTEAVKGYIAKVEVTYNFEAKTFHPHMHVLFFVDRSYFSKKYISADNWLKLWREVTGDSRITQVKVERLKGRGKTGTEADGVAEVAKYVAKEDDYTQSEEVFAEFVNAMRGRKVFRFGGLCKDLVKAFRVDRYGVFASITNAEQVTAEDFVSRLFMNWKGQEYQAVLEDLTDQDKKTLQSALSVKAVEEIETDRRHKLDHKEQLETAHKQLLEAKPSTLGEAQRKRRAGIAAKVSRLNSEAEALAQLQKMAKWKARN